MAQSTKSLVKKLIKMYTSGTMYNPCHYIHRHYGLTRLQSESFFFLKYRQQLHICKAKQTNKKICLSRTATVWCLFYVLFSVSHKKWYHFFVFFSGVEGVWRWNSYIRCRPACLSFLSATGLII